MKCHNCSAPMHLDRTEQSSRSESKWYKCCECNAEHMSTRLKLHDADHSLDPYSNFEASDNHETNAHDLRNFQLRMQGR